MRSIDAELSGLQQIYFLEKTINREIQQIYFITSWKKQSIEKSNKYILLLLGKYNQ
jgi:hypothetical protein